jgi:hypothetical protein
LLQEDPQLCVLNHMSDDNIDFGTSHPDIDSALEMYVGFGDFSYKTRTVKDTTEHLVMRLKKNQWKVHLRIEDEEVKTFDTEELATFLIHQVKMDRALKRRLFGLILVFIAVIVSLALYSVLILGIGATDDLETFLIAGSVSVAFIPVFCILMSSAERSVDDSVYAIRPNLIEVLQKMMDLKETSYQKRPLEHRIRRLQESL